MDYLSFSRQMKCASGVGYDKRKVDKSKISYPVYVVHVESS